MGEVDSSVLKARAEAAARDQKSTERAAAAAEERAERARQALKKAKKESKKASKAARKARKAAEAAGKALAKAAARIKRAAAKRAKGAKGKKTATDKADSKVVVPRVSKRVRRANVASRRPRPVRVERPRATETEGEVPAVVSSDESDTFLLGKSDLP
jgi:colicin import membrane protein